MDPRHMPLKARTMTRRAAIAAMVLAGCFFTQWGGLILLSRHLDPGAPWLLNQVPARSRTGNGAFMLQNSITLLLPKWHSGLVVGGVPLKFEPMPNTAVGYQSDIRIWDYKDSPASANFPWIDPPAWSRLAETVDIDELAASRYFRVIETAVGWPVPAIRGRVYLKLGTQERPRGGLPWIDPKYEWAIPVSAWRPTRNTIMYATADYPFLPLRPLFWGSLINTLFLALIYGIITKTAPLMLYIFPKYRENIRRSRSHCPKCDYDLGSLTRCPECGYVDVHDANKNPANK